MGLGVKWSKLIRFSVKYDVLIGAINYSCELSNVLDEGYQSQQQCATPAQFTKWQTWLLRITMFHKIRRHFSRMLTTRLPTAHHSEQVLPCGGAPVQRGSTCLEELRPFTRRVVGWGQGQGHERIRGALAKKFEHVWEDPIWPMTDQWQVVVTCPPRPVAQTDMAENVVYLQLHGIR